MKTSTFTTPIRINDGIWQHEPGKRVVFCTPTITKPHPAYLAALEASVPALDEAGWEHSVVYQVGCPYISAARSLMLRKALDAKADQVVFIDHDVSWRPRDLVRLLEAEGDVVAGTYRYKTEPEEYMGRLLTRPDGRPVVRHFDGALQAMCVPAGFLRVARSAVNHFIEHYPQLCYGERCNPHVDLFNHGAHDGVWYGEDYAFSRNWVAAGGQIWVLPELEITHHAGDVAYPGNFHQFLLRQPGGSESACPSPPTPT